MRERVGPRVIGAEACAEDFARGRTLLSEAIGALQRLGRVSGVRDVHFEMFVGLVRLNGVRNNPGALACVQDDGQRAGQLERVGGKDTVVDGERDRYEVARVEHVRVGRRPLAVAQTLDRGQVDARPQLLQRLDAG